MVKNYSKEILCAEDEPGIATLMKRVAKMQGLDILLAKDGEEAKELIASQASKDLSFPVIVTDLNMPRMNGIELINYVGEQVGKNYILRPEIFVVSGYIPDKAARKSKFGEVYEIGDHRFHQKPIDLINLWSTIRKEYDFLRSLR